MLCIIRYVLSVECFEKYDFRRTKCFKIFSGKKKKKLKKEEDHHGVRRKLNLNTREGNEFRLRLCFKRIIWVYVNEPTTLK